MIAAPPAHALSSKLTTVANQMRDMIFFPIKKWQMSDSISKEEALDQKTSSKKFKSIGPGYFFAGPREIWIRCKYKIPEKVLNLPVEGTKVSLVGNVEDYAEIYINGEMKQAFHRSTGRIVLSESAKPGDEFFIVMMIRRKGNDTGLIRDISIDYTMLEKTTIKVQSFINAFDSLDMLIGLEGQKADAWLPYLNKAADAIDVKALGDGKPDEFFASISKAVDILKPISDVVKKYSMLLVGYSHIDPAWLWTKDEGENIVWKGTTEKIFWLQESFPDFVYAANQMHCFRWMEKDYPELFKKIQEAVKQGKWEPVGAEWVEPDGNLPAGESYVRQFMYGRKYSKEKLGKVSTIGWTPDSFGYNWNMPQILKKCDMRGFVTQKISWNDTTRFPYNLFWWESPDGSRVLVYFPQGSYGESVQASKMVTELTNMKNKHGVDSNFVIFGIGDHGGGIPRDYAERAYALRESPLYPKIEFPTVEQIFDRMLEADKTLKFPTWDDELYLEYHRGTYTTQSNTKNNNRRNELRLMNAERFSSIAAIAAAAQYPFDKIEEAWKILLFNQFHDILPGSSITPVYKDADKDHAWVAGQAKGATDGSMAAIVKLADTTGAGKPVVLFNGLSWKRGDVVEVALSNGVSAASVTDDSGKQIPSQVIDAKGGGKSVIFLAKNLPAMGYAVYHVAEGKASKAAAAGTLKVANNVLENDFFKVTVDPKTGWVSGVLDKKNNVEILEPGKYGFQLQAYKELASSDAWDPRFEAGPDGIKPPAKDLMEMPDAEKVTVVENGPVRVTIMAERKFGEKSAFRTYYSLVRGVPVVFGRVDAKWHETNVFLKSAFNLNLDSDRATFEIPYAAIDRVTKPKTQGELAKWEMSGHRWVDYTDKAKNYGVTLLSFSKYGYDVKNNVLRMSLLRAPTGPDPLADRGNHSIPLAIYPHTGDWTSADSPLKGAEYNDPVMVFPATAHKGKLGKNHSFFSAGPDNVVISTIKRAEDGKGFVIRLVETSGKDTTAVINLPAKPKKVSETNLVERELGDIATPASTKFSVPIGHYEIKSIRVVF